jgi:hypothetical protein
MLQLVDNDIGVLTGDEGLEDMTVSLESRGVVSLAGNGGVITILGVFGVDGVAMTLTDMIGPVFIMASSARASSIE